MLIKTWAGDQSLSSAKGLFGLFPTRATYSTHVTLDQERNARKLIGNTIGG